MSGSILCILFTGKMRVPTFWTTFWSAWSSTRTIWNHSCKKELLITSKRSAKQRICCTNSCLSMLSFSFSFSTIWLIDQSICRRTVIAWWPLVFVGLVHSQWRLILTHSWQVGGKSVDTRTVCSGWSFSRGSANLFSGTFFLITFFCRWPSTSLILLVSQNFQHKALLCR